MNTTTTKLTPAALKNAVIKALKENKAIDIKALKLKNLTDMAEYMIVCTANSTTHANSLIKKVRDELVPLNIKPIGVEGEDTREWMLIDFGSVIVHVMLQNIREYYQLEDLWTITKEQTDKEATEKE